jgi:hypothetical protein
VGLNRCVWVLAVCVAAGCGRGKPSASRDEKVDPPGPEPAANPAPPPKPVRYRDGATVPEWGTLIDPDGDCTIERHPPGYVSIKVPDTLHEINPTKEKRNAPVIIRPVEGDFRAVVRVTGEFRPDAASNSQISSPFFGAGLVLWVDDGNLLVLARNAWSRGEEYSCFPPLFELFENGRPPRPTNPSVGPASLFQGDSTSLYLERKGDVVRGAYSNDGQNWLGWRETTVTLPQRASVGITAWSTAAKPLVVTFDRLQIFEE